MVERFGELERKVLDVCWDHEDEWVTVGTVVDALHDAHRRRWAYNTIMTVMGRLADKGVLDRRRDGRAHSYRPVVHRDGWAEHEASQAVAELLDTYGDAAAAGIAANLQDRPDLVAALRDALDDEPAGEG